MKTIIVLCAIAYLGAAAPAPSGDVPEGTKLTHTPTHSSTANILKREKKSPTEIVVTSLSPNMDTEFQSVQHTEPATAARSFSLKKPLIVKKKHGYRLYRDSEEEKASADSYETCGRQVKVKLCDEDRKFKHPMRKFQDQDLHMTEEDVKHSIKMAKEAVENLQRDLKHIEHTSGMKMAEASEADTELHEDIEVARQALSHIHENFGNLDSMNLRTTTSTDSKAMHDVRLTIARTNEERMAQWKEALKNIDKNVEIAANIEKSFKEAGNEELSLDKSKSEMEINDHKIEQNIGSHHKLIAESHTRASDAPKTDKMHKNVDANKELNDDKLEHITEDDMKVSASQLSEVTGVHHKGLNHRHLSRSDEEKNMKIEEGDHHEQQQKSSAHDIFDEKEFSEPQGSFSKIIKEGETASSSELSPMFKSENSHEETMNTMSTSANLHKDQERNSERNEDEIKSEKNLQLRTHETEDILTKSAEQTDFTKPVTTKHLIQEMATNIPDHFDAVARESMQTQTITHEEPMVHTGKSSEQLDITSLDTADQPGISMFVKSADLEDTPNHETQTQKLHQLHTTSLKSAEENMHLDESANNNMQARLNEEMRNVDELETNLHNSHIHGLSPMKKDEELNQHFNMRQSHLTELPSMENVQDFTEDLHSQHMGINNLAESHLSNEELNHNWNMEHMPSMKSAEEHMNHVHLDHLSHSHLAHPMRVTEDFETPFHIDHLSRSHLDDFSRMNAEGHDHMVHSMGMMHEPLSGSAHSHHHHDRLRQLNAMAKMREMSSMGGGVHPKFHANMRDAMEGFGSENRFRWQPAHESARVAYGSGVASSGVATGAVGVFPNANTGGCGIPLLLSCSPSVVSGSLAKTHAGSSYSAPSYRSEDEFVFHNKRDVKNTNEVKNNNVLRTPNIIKQKTGTVLENKL